MSGVTATPNYGYVTSATWANPGAAFFRGLGEPFPGWRRERSRKPRSFVSFIIAVADVFPKATCAGIAQKHRKIIVDSVWYGLAVNHKTPHCASQLFDFVTRFEKSKMRNPTNLNVRVAPVCYNSQQRSVSNISCQHQRKNFGDCQRPHKKGQCRQSQVLL